MFEVGEEAELADSFEVVVAAEGGAEAGQVADRGDLGSEAFAERFAVGGAAEVVVAAAAAGRLGDELELAAARLQLQDWFGGEVVLE